MADPRRSMERVLAFLGHPDPGAPVLDELVGQDGRPYAVESSDLATERGGHKRGRPFEGFFDSSIGRHRREMPAPVRRRFERVLEDHPLLRRYAGS